MADTNEIKRRYSLDDLLRVTGEITLERRGKKFKVHLRTLGVAADDARRVYATRKARLAYRQVSKEDSPERLELLEPLQRASKPDLIELLLAMKRSEFMRDARLEIVPVDVPEPDGEPTITDVVVIEEQQDTIERDLAVERAAYVERRLEESRNECLSRSDADLLAEATRLRVDAHVNAAFGDAYADATLFWAVYRDAQFKKPFFGGPDEVGEADGVLRDTLLSEYYRLDVFMQEPDGLKN